MDIGRKHGSMDRYLLPAKSTILWATREQLPERRSLVPFYALYGGGNLVTAVILWSASDNLDKSGH